MIVVVALSERGAGVVGSLVAGGVSGRRLARCSCRHRAGIGGGSGALAAGAAVPDSRAQIGGRGVTSL